MMQTINVERLTSTTFITWTDGPKFVIDTMAVGINQAGVTYIAAPLEDVAVVLQHIPAAAAVYVIAEVRDFLDIESLNLINDIRLLVI